jgi:hypothetical protein
VRAVQFGSAVLFTLCDSELSLWRELVAGALSSDLSSAESASVSAPLAAAAAVAAPAVVAVAAAAPAPASAPAPLPVVDPQTTVVPGRASGTNAPADRLGALSLPADVSLEPGASIEALFAQFLRERQAALPALVPAAVAMAAVAAPVGVGAAGVARGSGDNRGEVAGKAIPCNNCGKKGNGDCTFHFCAVCCAETLTRCELTYHNRKKRATPAWVPQIDEAIASFVADDPQRVYIRYTGGSTPGEVRPVEPRAWKVKPFSFKAFCFRERCEKTYHCDRITGISAAPF